MLTLKRAALRLTPAHNRGVAVTSRCSSLALTVYRTPFLYNSIEELHVTPSGMTCVSSKLEG